MNRVRQQIPSFVTTTELPVEATFETAEELLSMPWVKAWKDDPNVVELRQLVRNGLQDSSVDIELVVSCRDGREFVVGTLEDVAIGIPFEDTRENAPVYGAFLETLGFDIKDENQNAFRCIPRDNIWGLTKAVFTVAKDTTLKRARRLATVLGCRPE